MKKTEQTRTIFWISSLVAGALFSTGILVSVAVPAHAVLAPISLGAADSFAVLAGGAITNTAPTGNTLVRGDLGTFPNAATFVGAAGTTISGVNYGADATAQAAHNSLAATNVAIAALPAENLLVAAMSGTLTRGVYDQTSAVTLATTLTFDGQGDSSSVFVIRVVGAMATAPASNVILVNGAQSSNIFWKVTGAVDLGAGSTFRGNLLSVGAIAVGAGTVVEGRLLTEFGALSMASNTITKPGWASPSYTVTFSGNTSTSGSTSAQTANSSTALTSNGFLKAGYSFSGWNTAANGSGTAYADSAVYLFAASTTLYAQWAAVTSNGITWDNQSATTGVSTGGSTSYTTGLTITALPTLAPTKTGYTFTGWFSASSGGSAVTAGYTPLTPFGSITIYAQWSGTSNTVTYDSQSGTSVASGSFTTGTALTLAAAPTRTGYTFTGWFVAATGGTALVSGYSPTNTSSFTLYAQWAAIVLVPTTGPSAGAINAAQEAIDRAAAVDKAAAAKAAADKVAAADRAAVQAAVDKAAADKAAADRSAAVKAAAEVAEIARSVPSRIPAIVGQVTPGASLATANGVFIPTTLRIIPPTVEAADVRAVEIVGEGWKVAIATTNSVAGGSTMGRFDEFVVFEKGAVSSTDGAGFKPGSTVRLRLFSIPSLLGEAIVKADGTFSANWSIAASKPTGKHTLQVEGISPSGSLIRAEIGVLVRANSPKKAILLDQVFYNTSIWRLTSENKKKLNSVAKKISASKYSGILLYGFTDAATGLDNMRLSGQRNNSVKTYLQQLLPGVSIKVKSFGAANPIRKGRDKASLAFNRRVEILGQK